MTFDAVEAYRRLYLIRHVELEIVRRYYPDGQRDRSPMRCPVHLSIGQEGVAVGVALAMSGAHAWSTHRCHAHYLAWGGSLEKMLGELYGRATGCSGGRAGSMHLHAAGVGFMGTSAIVGSSVALAVGDAFAARLDGSGRVTVAFGGDSVPETGQFWEAVHFAALHRLKLLFVIEDNGLSTATPKHKRQPQFVFPLPTKQTPDDAASVYYGVDALRLELPAILQVKTRRFHEHVGMDALYETYPKDDPVVVGRSMAWIQGGRCSEIEQDVKVRVANAFRKAEEAPWPDTPKQ